MRDQPYDVVVIGGGNAGLCAALTARQAGASVIVLECAPRHFRGGNSRHTRNCRCAHDAPTDVADRVVPGRRVLRRSAARHRQPDRRGAGAAGHRAVGGLPRVDAAVRRPLSVVAARHAAPGTHQRVLPRRRQGADEQLLRRRRAPRHRRRVRRGGRRTSTCATASSTARRCVSDGRTADGARQGRGDRRRRVRGEPRVAARDLGRRGRQLHRPRHAVQHGHAAQADARRRRRAGRRSAACHAIAVDARAPKFDGGIVTRLDCLPLGIVVNTRAERFYDEGEDLWPKRYAIWGGLVAGQPDQIAYLHRRREGHGPLHAVGLSRHRSQHRSRGLRRRSTCLPTGSRRPSRRSTRRCGPARSITPCSMTAGRRGCRPTRRTGRSASTRRRSGRYPLRPGITFTYLGVKVDERARVLMKGGEPLEEHLRGRRDHGGQHPAQGLPRGRRHDDRHRVRPDRRRGGCASCRRLIC